MHLLAYNPGHNNNNYCYVQDCTQLLLSLILANDQAAGGADQYYYS